MTPWNATLSASNKEMRLRYSSSLAQTLCESARIIASSSFEVLFEDSAHSNVSTNDWVFNGSNKLKIHATEIHIEIRKSVTVIGEIADLQYISMCCIISSEPAADPSGSRTKTYEYGDRFQRTMLAAHLANCSSCLWCAGQFVRSLRVARRYDDQRI